MENNNEKYPVTTEIKKDLFETGGNNMMSPWFQEMYDKVKEEGVKEGIEQGKVKWQVMLLSSLIDAGKFTIDEAAKQLNMTVKEFKDCVEKYKVADVVS